MLLKSLPLFMKNTERSVDKVSSWYAYYKFLARISQRDGNAGAVGNPSLTHRIRSDFPAYQHRFIRKQRAITTVKALCNSYLAELRGRGTGAIPSFTNLRRP